jgi:hypothetical protein
MEDAIRLTIIPALILVLAKDLHAELRQYAALLLIVEAVQADRHAALQEFVLILLHNASVLALLKDSTAALKQSAEHQPIAAYVAVGRHAVQELASM